MGYCGETLCSSVILTGLLIAYARARRRFNREKKQGERTNLTLGTNCHKFEHTAERLAKEHHEKDPRTEHAETNRIGSRTPRNRTNQNENTPMTQTDGINLRTDNTVELAQTAMYRAF
jgi:hypothetical protein